MSIFYTLIVGLVVWIVLWSIGVGGFDAFLVTIVMLVVAATVHITLPFLPGNREPR